MSDCYFLILPYYTSLDPKNPSFDLGDLLLSWCQVRFKEFGQAARQDRLDESIQRLNSGNENP